MIPARIEGFTRVLGAPVYWDPYGPEPCCGLPIRDATTDEGTPVMWSAWEPTPDEISAIIAGSKVYLCVVGTQHPMVSVQADDRADLADAEGR